MKRLLLAILVISSLQSFAQTETPDDKQIIENDDFLIGLYKKHKAAKAAGFFTDTYKLITLEGETKGKTTVLQEMASPATRYDVYECLNRTVRVEGDKAVLTCTIHEGGVHDGTPFDTKYRSIQNWVKVSKIWKLSSTQQTALD